MFTQLSETTDPFSDENIYMGGSFLSCFDKWRPVYIWVISTDGVGKSQQLLFSKQISHHKL